MTSINPQAVASPLITILGPTASGKTRLAVQLAKRFDGDIISADSRQVYRGMDIGSGKDIAEYGNTPYHLIDIKDPDQEYNVFDFAKDFCRAFEGITESNKLPILAGGTGMYIDAVLSRYPFKQIEEDNLSATLFSLSHEELKQMLVSLAPDQHNETDLIDRPRTIQAIKVAKATKTINWPAFHELVLGIDISRDRVKKRITLRLKERLENGMIEEVEKLKEQGVSWEKLHFFGLEYRFIAQYLQGELNYNDMYQKLNSAIHYFAKQQGKWFRKMERKGHEIKWLQYESEIPLLEQAIKKIEQHLT